MTKKILRDRHSYAKNWSTAILGSFLLASTQQGADAANENSFRSFRQQNPGVNRQSLRAMWAEQRNQNRIENGGGAAQVNQAAVNAAVNASTRSVRTFERRFENHGPRNQSFQNVQGQMVNLHKGVNLDLGSQSKSITLGTNLFKDGGSVTINVGGKNVSVSAGDKVSAAEYVAVKQVLNGGQTVTLDNSGRATGGDVDLSALTQNNDTMRASDLVVPVNVTTTGDFGRQSDFRLLGDLDNSGTVHALSSAHSVRSGAIRADDITNQQGGLIKSDVDLTLEANGNLTNLGTITSQGSLTLAAGGTLTNSNSVSARGDVGLYSTHIVNSGSVVSQKGDINLDGPATAGLDVNNTGGTLNAHNNINVRSADYTGADDIQFYGGDLVSKQVNFFSGQGTSYVDVEDVTGVINGKGAAAHMEATTDNLILGNVCLTGDPTFRNTAGDITVTSDILVNEALTIIAKGDIITNKNVSYTAGGLTQGYDITLIAGAEITGTFGGANTPVIPPGANGQVTISGKASTTGGSVLFLGNNTVNSRGVDNSQDAKGGSIYLYAFEGGKAGSGRVDAAGAKLVSGGWNSAADGDVFIVAGAQNADAVTLGRVDTSGGTGGGSINVITAQPASSGGAFGPITYDFNGGLQPPYTLIASSTLGTGANVVINGANGQTRATENITIQAGGAVSLINAAIVRTSASAGIVDVEAGGNVTSDAGSRVDGDNVYLYSETGDIGVTSADRFTMRGLRLNASAPQGSVYVLDEDGALTITNGPSDAKSVFDVRTSVGSLNVNADIAAEDIFLSGNNNLNINGNSVVFGSKSIVLEALNDLTASGKHLLKGGDLTVSFNSGSPTLNTEVASLTTVNGSDLSILETDSIDINEQLLNNLSVQTKGAGTVTVNGPVTVDTLTLQNDFGDILFSGAINATLQVSANTELGTGRIGGVKGTITTPDLVLLSGAGGIINGPIRFTNGADPMSVTAQATGGNVSLEYEGTGVLTLNGSTGNKNYVLGAAQAASVNLSSAIAGSNDFFLETTTFVIDGGSLNFDNITIDSPSESNLVIDGGTNGGTFTSTAGTGSVDFTAKDGSLFTKNLLNFNGGDVNVTLKNNQNPNKFDNGLGTLNGDKNNTLTIRAETIVMGTIQNFKNVNIVEGNTIVNSDGNVDLPDNLTFQGEDLAIIASGNISGSLTLIDLSTITASPAGNLTILAGVAITPVIAGQDQNADPYVITGVSGTGGSINLGSLSILTSGVLADGGNVVIAAGSGGDPLSGKITLGSITSKGGIGFADGAVRITSPNGITVGDIDAGAGLVEIKSNQVNITNPINVQDGIVTGLGNLQAGAAGNGDINLAKISAGSVVLNGGNSTGKIVGTGEIDANSLGITTTTGLVDLTAGKVKADVLSLATTSGTFNFGETTVPSLNSTGAGTVNLTQNKGKISLTAASGLQDLTIVSDDEVTVTGTVNVDLLSLTGNTTDTNGVIIGGGSSLTANDLELITKSGQIRVFEDMTGTKSINIDSAQGILQSSLKTIKGGDLTVSYGTASSGINTAVKSITALKSVALLFIQEGDIELRALNASSSVQATVNNGNVTTGADITIPNLVFGVNKGSMEIAHKFTVTDQAFISAENGFTTKAPNGVLEATNKLFLESSKGSIGTDANNRANINATKLTLQAPTGNIFVNDVATGATSIDADITTTGTIDIVSAGSALTSASKLSGNNVRLAVTGGDLTLTGAITAQNQIALTQNGDILDGTFAGGLTGLQLVLKSLDGGVGTAGDAFDVAVGFDTIGATAATLVNLQTTRTTAVNLLEGGAIGDFTLNAANAVNIAGNITSADGAIVVATKGGLLQVLDGVDILGETKIELTNTGSVRKVDRIAIGANASIITDATKPGAAGIGSISIVQGKAKPGRTRTITNVTQTEQGGDILFGGSRSQYIAATPDNKFSAIGTNLYFSTTQTKKDGGMSFGGGVVITADPPVPQGTPIYINDGRGFSLQEATAPQAPSPINVSNELAQLPAVQADTSNLNTFSLNNASLNQMSQSALNNSLTNLAFNDVRLGSLTSDLGDNSYFESSEPVAMEMDAVVCTDYAIATNVKKAGGNGTGFATMPHQELVTLDNGSVLFMPSKDTTVVTPKGKVKLGADSLAMVIVDDNQLSVYDINDSHKRSVSVEAGSRTIVLSPGRHVVVTDHNPQQFSDINPVEAMMHRGVSRVELASGKKAFTSEFSLPAAAQVLKPLKAIFASNDPQAKKVSGRMVKTSAVLMHVSGSAAPFQHHVRPRKVALK